MKPRRALQIRILQARLFMPHAPYLSSNGAKLPAHWPDDHSSSEHSLDWRQPSHNPDPKIEYGGRASRRSTASQRRRSREGTLILQVHYKRIRPAILCRTVSREARPEQTRLAIGLRLAGAPEWNNTGRPIHSTRHIGQHRKPASRQGRDARCNALTGSGTHSVSGSLPTVGGRSTSAPRKGKCSPAGPPPPHPEHHLKRTAGGHLAARAYAVPRFASVEPGRLGS